jgi:hypothetical protein
VMHDLDRFVFAAEHVRFWWFPMTGTVRVSSSDRTNEVPTRSLLVFQQLLTWQSPTA